MLNVLQISTCSMCQSREAAGTHIHVQGQQEQYQQEGSRPVDALAEPHPTSDVAMPHPMDVVAVDLKGKCFCKLISHINKVKY